ncbi:MAG TPA: hypothetical protein VII91_01785 [Bauldia sp.]
MPDKNAQLAKSVDVLTHQEAEVLDLAKDQRAAADRQQAAANLQHTAANLQEDAANRQHVNAHKLETVGAALKGDLATLKTRLQNRATK